MKCTPKYSRLSRGFSVVELVLIIGFVGIIAAMVVGYYGKIHVLTNKAKLNSDLRILNSAVSGYLNFGGQLGDSETTETVIEKLKSKASKATAKTVVGLSGSFLDPRLEVVMQTGEEAASGMARIYYDAELKKFVSANEGPAGIREFILNSDIIETQAIEDRTSVVNFASVSTWIWDYGADVSPTYPTGGTSPIDTNPIPVGLDPVPVPVDTPDITLLLQPPIISHTSGGYPMDHFDLPVTLANHNPAGSSSLTYSLNYGGWQPYTGPIMVPGGSNLRARATPLQPEWTSSYVSAANYSILPDVLDPPVIDLSAASFGESTPTIEVAMSNPNIAGISNLYYALKSPSGTFPPLSSYVAYTAPFLVDESSYPDGFIVQAYARSVDTTLWGDSGFAAANAEAEFFDIPLNGDRILFVIDASSSMNNEFCDTGLERYEVAVSELISAISALPEAKEFGIAMFDGGQHWIYNGATMQVADSANKQAAITAVSAVDNDSGTNYEVGLAYPLQFTSQPDQVIFLSDGGPNSETSWLDELAALVMAGIQVDTVGIESNSSEKTTLEFIASESGGTARFLDCDGEIESNFSGYTQADFGTALGRNGKPLKIKIKANNGHGNNYDGVDGTNPATIKDLVELPDSGTDDEVKVKMPKNSAYFESGDPVSASDSPNAILFSEAPFSFSSVGESFRIGHLSYYNGDTKGNSEISEIEFTVAVNFETPSDQEVSIPMTVQFTNLADKGDSLKLSGSAGASWPSVVLDGASYELVPTFALTAPDKNGTLSESVALGETAVFQIDVQLVPVP